VEKALAEKSLQHFIRQAWPVVEPKEPFVGGWHIDAICEHLEAITNLQIQNLIINVPPRHMKSLSVTVFWPCWEWGPKDMGHIRWLFSSYAERLSKRDSLKCRRLIMSPWYQERWGHRYHIVSDQNEKLRFENSKTGYRIATSVGGVGTGEGGDRIVADDPHNVIDGESEVKRETVLLWWDESMATRLNDENTGAKVVIMQRVHDADLCGHILEQELDYVHLCLPARYEGNRVKTCIPLDKPFEDPRAEDGEPLWPGKFGQAELDKRERGMTEYAVAGQHQQRPSPRGGGIFKVEKFEIIEAMPGGKVEPILDSVRYWDKAGTEGGGKRTAGVLMHRLRNGKQLISDVVKGQWGADKREAHIRQTAMLGGLGVDIWVEQEPGSGGKESAEWTIKNMAGFVVRAERVTGDKETRAEPYSIQVNAGNVQLLKADWNRDFIREHEKAPMGEFKDQWDAAAGAFNKLNVSEKLAGVWGR